MYDVFCGFQIFFLPENKFSAAFKIFDFDVCETSFRNPKKLCFLSASKTPQNLTKSHKISDFGAPNTKCLRAFVFSASKTYGFRRPRTLSEIQRILTQQKTFGFLHALRSSASWQRNEVSHALCLCATVFGGFQRSA